jgi:TolA-binding protein
MFADVTDVEQARFDAVVQVRCQISNLIGEIDDLSLQRWTLAEEVLGQLTDSLRDGSRENA